AGQALLEGLIAAGIGDDGQLGTTGKRALGQSLHGALGRQSHELEHVGIAVDEVEGAGAARARRPQHGDALAASVRRGKDRPCRLDLPCPGTRCSHAGLPPLHDPSNSARAGECTLMTKAASATAAAAATRPSTRSMTPPWPGINVLESLAPNRRLRADSARSPTCAA